MPTAKHLTPSKIISTSDLGLLRVSSGEPNVMVVSDDSKVRRNVSRALVSNGCAAFSYSPSADSRSILDRELDMYIIDIDAPDAESIILHAREQFPHVPLLVVANHALSNETFELLMTSGVSNVIARHGAEGQRSLVDESELITTCRKLFTGDIFGISKYLATWGARIYHEDVGSTRDKSRTLTNIETFLARLQFHNRVSERVSVVADEMITNAMFGAPRDATGKRKYASMARTDSLRLEPAERVEVEYACDGRNFAIAVNDRFGSLQRSHIMNYLKDQFAGEPRHVRDGSEAGGGVGLHMVLDSATQLVFNIQPGLRTEAITTFYVRSGHRTMRSTGKSLNVFFKT